MVVISSFPSTAGECRIVLENGVAFRVETVTHWVGECHRGVLRSTLFSRDGVCHVRNDGAFLTRLAGTIDFSVHCGLWILGGCIVAPGVQLLRLNGVLIPDISLRWEKGSGAATCPIT